MSLFSIFNSLANGTLVEDAINGLEKGVEQFENFVGEGESKLSSVASVTDNALQNIVDGAEKAASVSDIVAKKLE